MRTIKLGCLAAAILAATAGKMQAAFQAFDFSFTGYTSGNYVSGEILLPDGDGTGPAFKVQLEQFPLGFSPPGFPIMPTNATDWPLQGVNDFTVTDGKLTYANFQAAYNSKELLYVLVLSSDTPSALTSFAENQEVVGAATFSARPTPEPGSIMLWCVGIVTASVFQVVRRRQGRAAGSNPAC
jgi:hypothetical protein